MLKELKISNFAIIENLRVEFQPGLNVLTGETGAGKSILINALNLLLGGRADMEFIRSGEDSASVEGLFHVTDRETLSNIDDLGIEVEDGEVIIKRIISLAGKNRCFLNDNSLTVSALAKIGNRLVDIHGQHEHQALLHSETHVNFLDLFGKSMADRKILTNEFSGYKTDFHKRDELLNQEKDRLQREDFLKFQIAEIDQAGISEGEDEELNKETHKLRHAEQLIKTLQQAQNLLTENEGSALEQLEIVAKELETLPAIDPALEKPAQQARTIGFEIEALTEEIRKYLHSVEFNPSRQEEIEDRLAEINTLKRKYGGDVNSILAHRERSARELESLFGSRETLEALEEELQKRERKLAALSKTLAEKRESTAKILKKNVEKELKELSMKQVQIGVRFDYEPDPKGFVTFRNQKVQLNATGLGTLEFLFSPNPGEDLRPLAKIVSGGELSRVMLALKSILNEQDAIPIMVFDEVDSGIGGKVAEQVGRKLKNISAQKQIFTITHLPQIAGMASAHYLVYKEVRSKKTRSSIRELTFEQRVEEIARMSGGKKITPTTLKHAREIIQP